MAQNSTDSRVRRTKKLLREGLTALLHEKSIKKITVRELSDRVEINRGTFYLHYKDIYDLVAQIEDELFSNFEELLSKYTFEDLTIRPHAIFSDICLFLYENRDICSALLGDNGDISFLFKMRTFLRNKCFSDFAAVYEITHLEHYQYIYTFFEAGAVGLIRYWLEHPEDKRTPEDIAYLVEHIFKNGASVLLQSNQKLEVKNRD